MRPIALALAALALAPPLAADADPLAHTYSIVARDAKTGEMGVAVQSHWFAVGAGVTWAEAGVGAIATQSFIDPGYGVRGLALLREGKPADEVLRLLLAADPQRETRQVAIVDTAGRVAAHTGAACIQAAGHRTGTQFSAQANLMANDRVWPAMSEAFEKSTGDLADRLLAALEAGEAAGGDIRGSQSAALLIVRASGSGRPWAGADRVFDLRVDDHPQPIAELSRILALHRVYFEKPKPEDFLSLEGALLAEVRACLTRLGYYRGPAEGAYDEVTGKALADYAGVENLEERLAVGPWIDPVVLGFLRRPGGGQ